MIKSDTKKPTGRMNLDIINADEFNDQFNPLQKDVFLVPAFNELNRYKVEDIFYLIFTKEPGTKAGFIFGKSDDWISTPFSAPYGGLISNNYLSQHETREIIDLLCVFCKNRNLNCRITLPASIVTDAFTFNNNLLQDSLTNYGFHLKWSDYNQHIDLTDHTGFNPDILRRVKKSESLGLKFQEKEMNEKNLKDVYSIIRINHEALGYPMNMSIEAFFLTSKILPVHLFSIEKDEELLAGAICYQTRKNIMQLICWGDNVSKRKNEPSMPLLGYSIISRLKNYRQDIEVLDMGPSSYHGNHNTGLINFKNSLGCKTLPKNTFVLENVKI